MTDPYPPNFPDELKCDIAVAALKVEARKKALAPDDALVDHDAMRPLLIGLDLNGGKLMQLATAIAIQCAVGTMKLVETGQMPAASLLIQVGKGQWVDGLLTGMLLAEQRAAETHVDVSRQLSEAYANGYEAGVAEGRARAAGASLREKWRP